MATETHFQQIPSTPSKAPTFVPFIKMPKRSGTRRATNIFQPYSQAYTVHGTNLDASGARRAPNTEATDLAIVCGEATYNVHKAAICRHSAVWKAMLVGGSHISEISLDREEPHVVEAMIRFCYSEAYDIRQPTTSTVQRGETESASLFHAKMLLLADKYEMDELLIYATSKYTAELTNLCADEFVFDTESWVEAFDSVDVIYKVRGDNRHVLRYKVANGIRQRIAKLQSKVKEAGVGMELVRYIIAYLDQNKPFAADLLFSFVKEGGSVSKTIGGAIKSKL